MRGFSAIGLFDPKDPKNIGSVLRAGYCFDTSVIVLEGQRYQKKPFYTTDTTKAYKHIPLIHGNLLDCAPVESTLVAVDLIDGACPIDKYVHPDAAFYIFGPEDGTLNGDILNACKHRVMIPTRQCLNLAMAVNIVLYDRCFKRKEWPK